MAVPLDQSSKEDDLKTQFITREGTYRLMNLSEYSRPNRVGYTSNQNSPQVRVSLVSLNASDTTIRSAQEDSGSIATNGHGPADLQVNQISSTTPSSSSAAGMDHVSNGPGGQRLIGALNSVGDRICFNFGKELFVYPYRGMKKVRGTYTLGTVTICTRLSPGVSARFVTQRRLGKLRLALRYQLIALIMPPLCNSEQSQLSRMLMCQTVWWVAEHT